jgi:polyisoprenoid-binding protein YceI
LIDMSTVTTVTAPAQTRWTIDPAHSNVEFAVRHLMISTVRGRFADVQGTVTLDPVDLSTAAVDVTIGAASIDTRMSQRDDHLRSADFFDVAQHPTLTFKSRRAAVQGDQVTLTGDLTIRGVTREVVLAVTAEGEQADPWGGTRRGFVATGKIKRSDFGLTWNQALEAGGVAVGDEVKITIDAQLVQQ